MATIKTQTVPNIEEKVTAGKGMQKPTFKVHRNLELYFGVLE